MEQQMIFSVSEANNFIKALLDRVPQLQEIFVRGEISNYKLYPSGHHYFTLKDAEGAMRCVLFKGNALRLRFRPENGMKVIAFGRISVFPRDGAYQLYVSELSPEGAGDLHVAFEQLKAQLEREGLFDPAHKKPLPKYPKTIAIITSPAGAAVHDMLRILRARWPLTEVREQIQGRGPHHHGPRWRLHRGPLGVQRRARGARHLRIGDPRHLRRRSRAGRHHRRLCRGRAGVHAVERRGDRRARPE